MATLNYTDITRLHGEVLVTYEDFGDEDVGVPFEPPAGYWLESVQVNGPSTGGGTFYIDGSNDDTNYHELDSDSVLTLPDATAVLKPKAQTKSFRPRTSGGAATDIQKFILRFVQKN